MKHRKAQRPDTSPKAVEKILLQLGEAPSMAYAEAIDFKIIVPIVLKALGAEKIAEIVDENQSTYGLNDSVLTSVSVKAVARWAEYVLEEYRQKRQ